MAPRAPADKFDRRFWIAAGAAAALGAACLAALVLPDRLPAPESASPAAPPVRTPSPPDAFAPLVGRWLREDGGYRLEIRRVESDGRVEAAYYNPRPIRIARAEASRDGETARLRVEFDDENYRGSRYDVTYARDGDHLVGTYYQATQGATYQIEFVRIR
jgi:hypothetical protein